MFNNNINKPAITVFLPLTSAKTSFCQWQKLVLLGRFFPRKKTVFTGHWQKLANPAMIQLRLRRRYVLWRNRDSRSRPGNCDSRPGNAISRSAVSL